FVPRVSFRLKTEDGFLPLPQKGERAIRNTPGNAVKLTEELRNATHAVILTSHRRRELDIIVSEAISASDRFEEIAAEIEGAGYEIVICIDFSGYARLDPQASKAPAAFPHSIASDQPTPTIRLSSYDLKFLNGLKIKTDA